MKILFLALLSSVMMISKFDCGSSRGSLDLKNIRIENMRVEKIFPEGDIPKKVSVIWENEDIDISYLPAGGGEERKPIQISFETDDGSTFTGDNGIRAWVETGGAPFPLSWTDIAEMNEKTLTQLTLVISASPVNNDMADMVYVPGGTFRMGSKWAKDEKPVHSVTVSGFYMDKYEVTVAQYENFCRSTRRRMPRQPVWNDNNHPVVMVSWKNARAYAKWAGKRLPTEAEWEYAARGGSKNLVFAWGNTKPKGKNGDNIADEAIRSEKKNWAIWKGFYDGFVYTAPVGSFYANPFGLHDMSGNVKEWCSDWYASDWYSRSPAKDPKGPKSGIRRVLRGGSWNYGPRNLRLTKRFRYKDTLVLNYIGFRCVKD